MEQRLKKEAGDRDIASIKELNLGNCKSSNVVGLSEDWKNLEKLNLTNVGLNTLKGFPRLPSLKKLELGGNNLCEGFDALACLPKLEELDLSKNEISELEAFEPLSQVKTLKRLNASGCSVCNVEHYRKKLLDLIPSLVQLDGSDKKSVTTEQKNGLNGEVGKDGDEDESPDEEEDNDDDSLDDEEDEDDEADEEDIPLEALYGKINDEGEDDDDFEAKEDDDDEDIQEEEEDDDDDVVILSKDDDEDTEEVRGTKRKHEEEN